ncbi:MAG: hypothetical protein ACK4ME_10575, partial [Fimbriimonadales bacterium]
MRRGTLYGVGVEARSCVGASRAWLGWSAAYFALQLGAPLITLPPGWLLISGVLLSTLLLMATLLGLVFAWAREAERFGWLAPAMLAGGVPPGGGGEPRPHPHPH